MTSMKFYTGIGSRDVSPITGQIMTDLAELLEKRGYILRSGGANGADTYFESGVLHEENKEIFLPWKGFNGNTSPLYSPSFESFKMAEKFHPAFLKLSDAGRKLMARNSHQVLGKNLNTPSDFLVYQSTTGKGGTMQAVRIANYHKIPVFNLDDENTMERILKFIGNKINNYEWKA